MNRSSFIAGCAVALALSASAIAQGPHADTAKLFNGSSLAGWHPQGAAQWRAAGGAIVGSAASGAGTLVLDKSYQDMILKFAFQCRDCDAGVVLRQTAHADKPGATSALYAGISGPDALTLFRIAADAQGNVTERTQLFKWTSRRGPPGMSMTIVPAADGWQQVRIQLRGNVTAPAEGRGIAGAPAAAPTAQEAVSIYGPLSLRVASGEVRIKDVSVTDLLHPAAGVLTEATSPAFRRVQLTDRFYAEGISVGDVNKDGVMDALSGPYAYLGPTFVRAVEIYWPQTYAIANPTMGGQYTDNFLNYVHDFTGDGWSDYLKINFNGAYLYVNPKGESRHWPMHQVSEGGVSSETTQLGDVDGDGKVELLMTVGSAANRVVGLLKPGADPTARWTFVPISEKADWGGHGYGFGDINGDGKHDILQGSGWWEQPAAGAASGLWTFHAVPFGRGTDAFIRGADIFAYDINGDKLPDVVTSLFAHGPGLVWYEQQRTGQGPITWKMHMIMDRPDASADERKTWETTDKSFVFTELHALQLIDMDGDGLRDIVTGKRWFSHGMEYPENDRDDPPLLAWFKLVRKPGGQVEFVPNVINNYVGLGTQIAVTDMNGDARPDVLTAARKGAYIFFNNVTRAGAKGTNTSP